MYASGNLSGDAPSIKELESIGLNHYEYSTLPKDKRKFVDLLISKKRAQLKEDEKKRT